MPATNSNYSKRAEQALAFAEEEARRRSHYYVGQEHLLLGLVRVEDGVAAQLLARSNVTPDMVHTSLDVMLGRGEPRPHPSPPYTPRLVRALELATEQARRLNHRYIGTEHLLLGLLAEGEGVGAQILAGFGVTLDSAEQELERLAAERGRGPQGIKGLASRIAESERGVRRYSLVLPEALFQQVQEVANAEQATVADLFRRFTKLGLLIMEAQRAPDCSIVIRHGEHEQRLIVL